MMMISGGFKLPQLRANCIAKSYKEMTPIRDESGKEEQCPKVMLLVILQVVRDQFVLVVMYRMSDHLTFICVLHGLRNRICGKRWCTS